VQLNRNPVRGTTRITSCRKRRAVYRRQKTGTAVCCNDRDFNQVENYKGTHGERGRFRWKGQGISLSIQERRLARVPCRCLYLRLSLIPSIRLFLRCCRLSALNFWFSYTSNCFGQGIALNDVHSPRIMVPHTTFTFAANDVSMNALLNFCTLRYL